MNVEINMLKTFTFGYFMLLNICLSYGGGHQLIEGGLGVAGTNIDSIKCCAIFRPKSIIHILQFSLIFYILGNLQFSKQPLPP
jgi:hypothetical protein